MTCAADGTWFPRKPPETLLLQLSCFFFLARGHRFVSVSLRFRLRVFLFRFWLHPRPNTWRGRRRRRRPQQGNKTKEERLSLVRRRSPSVGVTSITKETERERERERENRLMEPQSPYDVRRVRNAEIGSPNFSFRCCFLFYSKSELKIASREHLFNVWSSR